MKAEDARKLTEETQRQEVKAKQDRFTRELQNLIDSSFTREFDNCLSAVESASERGERSTKLEVEGSRIFYTTNKLNKLHGVSPIEDLQVARHFANQIDSKLTEIGYKVRVKQCSTFHAATPGWYSDWTGYNDGDPEGTVFFLEIHISW